MPNSDKVTYRYKERAWVRKPHPPPRATPAPRGGSLLFIRATHAGEELHGTGATRTATVVYVSAITRLRRRATRDTERRSRRGGGEEAAASAAAAKKASGGDGGDGDGGDGDGSDGSEGGHGGGE